MFFSTIRSRFSTILKSSCRCNSSSSSSSSSSESIELNLDAMKPSESFVKKLPKSLKQKYAKTLEEFEIFLYMGKYVPTTMTEADWQRTLELESLSEKVSFWEFLALTHRRKEGRDRRKITSSEEFRAFMNQEQKKFDNGEMGYGPDMYQLIHNPMRNKKKIQNIEGCRIWSSIRTEMPKVALDLQYYEKMTHRNRNDLGRQVQYAISENFAAKRPLQLSFVNAPDENQMMTWIEKSIGYYGGAYTSQTLLPEISQKGIKQFFPNDENYIYLSNYARDVLDGPLTADVIGVCVTMDHKRDSIGAARRAGIRAYRLPIHRYVQWKSGPQFLPLPNILNILREVYENGGDWKNALYNNISKRHLVDINEDEKKQMQALRRKSRENEKQELIEAIMMATEGK